MPSPRDAPRAASWRQFGERGTGSGREYAVFVAGDEEYRHRQLAEQRWRASAQLHEALADIFAERRLRHVRDLRIEVRQRRLLARHALPCGRMNAELVELRELGRRAAHPLCD